MILEWAQRATADLMRVSAFLASRGPGGADRLAARLMDAPERLREHPRIGRPLPAYAPREVRRLIVGRYELRYEIKGNTVIVLRIWHEREHRTATDD